MRYFYAQIDGAGYCTGVIDTHAVIDAPHMIPIESADASYIGKRWTGAEWVAS